MTFAFGLIHGLGFAAGLQSLVDSDNIRLLALVAFNLGVELGQVAAAMLLLPALSWCRRSLKGETAIDWTARGRRRRSRYLRMAREPMGLGRSRVAPTASPNEPGSRACLPRPRHRRVNATSATGILFPRAPRTIYPRTFVLRPERARPRPFLLQLLTGACASSCTASESSRLA